MASDFGCMFSVGASCFKDKFCASKKGGMGEVDEFQHRVAALAGCRTVLVATGWMIFQHVSTNGHKNHSATPVRAPFLGL